MAATPADLFERDAELAELQGLVRGLEDGAGRVVLIEGPAGIGKSRLLAELRREAAEAGLVVLAARAGELEREFPFGVVRQLFEGVLADPALRGAALAGAAAPALAVLGPVGEAVADEGVADTSFAALHGLFWLALNLAAERPLVLVVDDLHWCDRPSLRFLAYLVRRLDGVPILLAATVRTGEAGTDPVLVGEIAHDPAEISVRPGPLSVAAVGTLIGARLGGDVDPAFAAACQRATGGNPLFLRQLLTALEADGVRPDAAHVGVVLDIGPRAVSRTVLVRLGRLPPAAVAVARAAAVLGESAELPTVAAVAGLTETEVAEATRDLVRVEILRPEPPLGFVHPLVRDAVYRELPPGERELLHERAARLLTAAGAPVEQVAAQLLASPRRGEAATVALLAEAGRLAVRRGASESAMAYLRRALEEPPPAEQRPHVLLELGLAEGLTHGQAALEHLTAAYEILADPGERLLVANVLSRLMILGGDATDAKTLLQRAAAELRPDQVDERRALEAAELMAVSFGAGERTELRRLEPYRQRAGPGPEGPGTRLLGGVAAWHWMFAGGAADVCAARALEVLAPGDLMTFDDGLLSIPAYLLPAIADRPEGLDVWEPFLAEAHRRGSTYAISAVHLWRGMTLFLRGELEEADASLEASREEFTAWGHGYAAMQYVSAVLVQIRLARGDLPGARAALALGSDPGDRVEGSFWWLNARGDIELVDGDYAGVLETSEATRSRFPTLLNPVLSRWRAQRAVALDRLGRREEALALADEDLELARAWGGPGALSRCLRGRGELRGSDGLEDLEEAVHVVEGSPARYEHARSLASLGSALRRGRRPADAREPLRRALELAASCGAAGLVEHVRGELYAAGARPRSTALSGVESLTASERRVAVLAIDGQSNREIAQTLFVTPKTVEVHLSNAYRKLGVRSRRELAPALVP